MNNRPLNEYNAKPVLERLEKMIDYGTSRQIILIYDDLSIFDWWPEKLTVSHMKQMRTFLKEAIKLGYTGYVCFKVGASGCANGMWAYKKESTDGYSPKDSEALYRSFTPDYTYYGVCHNDQWLPAKEIDGNSYDSLKTIRDLENYINTLKSF